MAWVGVSKARDAVWLRDREGARNPGMLPHLETGRGMKMFFRSLWKKPAC